MVKFDSTWTAEGIAKALVDEIKGKTVIVTGVTPGGYGAEVSRVLALVGAKVILASRNLEKIQETIKHIKAQTPNAELRELVIDLGSQQSVRKAAAEVLEYTEPVDVLILNAGIMGAPYRKTPEGLESQFGINHIGNFLFTNLIMPKLLEAPAPRVVSVSSLGHAWGTMRFDDYNFQDGKVYDKWVAYGQSKTASILFCVELAERYKDKKLLAFSLTPTGSITNLQRHMTTEDYLKFSGGFYPDGRPKGPLARSVGETSGTHIIAAFDPSIADKSGSYLVNCEVATDPKDLQPYACDKKDAKKLWTLSEEIVGQKFDV